MATFLTAAQMALVAGFALAASPADACESNYAWTCKPVPSIEPAETTEPAANAKPLQINARRRAAAPKAAKQANERTARKEKRAAHKAAARRHIVRVAPGAQRIAWLMRPVPRRSRWHRRCRGGVRPRRDRARPRQDRARSRPAREIEFRIHGGLDGAHRCSRGAGTPGACRDGVRHDGACDADACRNGRGRGSRGCPSPSRRASRHRLPPCRSAWRRRMKSTNSTLPPPRRARRQLNRPGCAACFLRSAA